MKKLCRKSYVQQGTVRSKLSETVYNPFPDNVQALQISSGYAKQSTIHRFNHQDLPDLGDFVDTSIRRLLAVEQVI